MITKFFNSKNSQIKITIDEIIHYLESNNKTFKSIQYAEGYVLQDFDPNDEDVFLCKDCDKNNNLNEHIEHCKNAICGGFWTTWESKHLNDIKTLQDVESWLDDNHINSIEIEITTNKIKKQKKNHTHRWAYDWPINDDENENITIERNCYWEKCGNSETINYAMNDNVWNEMFEQNKKYQ